MTSPYQVRLRALRQPTIRLRPRALYEPRDPTRSLDPDARVLSPLSETVYDAGPAPTPQPEKSAAPDRPGTVRADAPERQERRTDQPSSSARGDFPTSADRVVTGSTTVESDADTDTDAGTAGAPASDADRSLPSPHRVARDRGTTGLPAGQRDGRADSLPAAAVWETTAAGRAADPADPMTARAKPALTPERRDGPDRPTRLNRPEGSRSPHEPRADAGPRTDPGPRSDPGPRTDAGPRLDSSPASPSLPPVVPPATPALRPAAGRAKVAQAAIDAVNEVTTAALTSGAVTTAAETSAAVTSAAETSPDAAGSHRPVGPPPVRSRPGRGNATPVPVDVHVSIGRIDVRSGHAAPSSPPEPRAVRRPTQSTLEDYIRARTAGRVG